MHCPHCLKQLSRIDDIRTEHLVALGARLERVESMVAQGLAHAMGHGRPPPAKPKRLLFMLSNLFVEYADLTRNEVRDF